MLKVFNQIRESAFRKILVACVIEYFIGNTVEVTVKMCVCIFYALQSSDYLHDLIAGGRYIPHVFSSGSGFHLNSAAL